MSKSIVLKNELDWYINQDNNHILFSVVQQNSISPPPFTPATRNNSTTIAPTATSNISTNSTPTTFSNFTTHIDPNRNTSNALTLTPIPTTYSNLNNIASTPATSITPNKLLTFLLLFLLLIFLLLIFQYCYFYPKC